MPRGLGRFELNRFNGRSCCSTTRQPVAKVHTKDSTSCCGIGGWSPCSLALRRLAQAMRGATHFAGPRMQDTYWLEFDLESFVANEGPVESLAAQRILLCATHTVASRRLCH